MRNPVALWAGIAAFFSTILAIGAIDVLDPNDRVQFLGGVVVGLITGGAVYAKQQLDDAKQERVHAGSLVVTERGDKTTYSLELDGAVDNLEDKKEVVFKVRKA